MVQPRRNRGERSWAVKRTPDDTSHVSTNQGWDGSERRREKARAEMDKRPRARGIGHKNQSRPSALVDGRQC